MVRIILSLVLTFSQNFALANGNNSPVQGDYAIGLMKSDTNFVLNPIAERNNFNVSTSSATATRDATTEKLYGKSSWICDASAQNGYCEFTLKTITEPAVSGSCAAYMYFKGDATQYQIQILDGSANLLSSSPTLTNATAWTLAEATYPCGSSRKVRFTQTGSGTGAAVNLGVFYGLNQNVGTVSQATFVGTWDSASTTNCEWQTTSTASLANFAADTDCPSPTIVGADITAAGTKIPGFVLNASPGTYIVKADIQGKGSTTLSGSYALSDGTTTSGYKYNNMSTSDLGVTVIGTFTYTDAGSKTIQLKGMTSTGTLSIRGDVAASSGGPHFYVTKLPASSEQVIRMNNTNFDWTTCPTITLTNFGTTSSEVFKCRRVGSNLEMQGKFTLGTTVGTAASMSIPYGAVSSSKGTTGVSSYGRAIKSAGASAYIRDYALIASPGDTTIKFGTLHNDQTLDPLTSLTGTQVGASGNVIVIEKLSIPIEGWSENQNAPLIAGGVTSDSSGAEKTLRVRFGGASETSACTSNPCTVYSTSTSGVTVAYAAGVMTMSIPSGTFSAKPTCDMSVANKSSSDVAGDNLTVDSATQVTMKSVAAGPTNQNFSANVICVGPR